VDDEWPSSKCPYINCEFRRITVGRISMKAVEDLGQATLAVAKLADDMRFL
jgi:hypothetical protein